MYEGERDMALEPERLNVNFHLATLKKLGDFSGGHSKIRTVFEMFDSREH